MKKRSLQLLVACVLLTITQVSYAALQPYSCAIYRSNLPALLTTVEQRLTALRDNILGKATFSAKVLDLNAFGLEDIVKNKATVGDANPANASDVQFAKICDTALKNIASIVNAIVANISQQFDAEPGIRFNNNQAFIKFHRNITRLSNAVIPLENLQQFVTKISPKINVDQRYKITFNDICPTIKTMLENIIAAGDDLAGRSNLRDQAAQAAALQAQQEKKLKHVKKGKYVLTAIEAALGNLNDGDLLETQPEHHTVLVETLTMFANNFQDFLTSKNTLNTAVAAMNQRIGNNALDEDVAKAVDAYSLMITLIDLENSPQCDAQGFYVWFTQDYIPAHLEDKDNYRHLDFLTCMLEGSNAAHTKTAQALTKREKARYLFNDFRTIITSDDTDECVSALRHCKTACKDGAVNTILKNALTAALVKGIEKLSHCALTSTDCAGLLKDMTRQCITDVNITLPTKRSVAEAIVAKFKAGNALKTAIASTNDVNHIISLMGALHIISQTDGVKALETICETKFLTLLGITKEDLAGIEGFSQEDIAQLFPDADDETSEEDTTDYQEQAPQTWYGRMGSWLSSWNQPINEDEATNHDGAVWF